MNDKFRASHLVIRESKPVTGGTQTEWNSETELKRLRALYQLLNALTCAHGLEEVYEAAITSLLSATEAERAAILMFDDEGVVRFQAWRGLSTEYRDATTGHTPWPKGTRDAQPLIVKDVRSDESLRAYREVICREGIRALAFIPLVLGDGVFGKLMLYYPEPHNCAGDELAIAQSIAGHVAIATERTRAELAGAQSERRLQAILDNSPAVILLQYLQGKYELVTRLLSMGRVATR